MPIPNNCLNETSKIKNLENRVVVNNRNKCERSRYRIMAQNRKQNTLKRNRKQTKKSTLYELREEGKEGGILYAHICICARIPTPRLHLHLSI